MSKYGRFADYFRKVLEESLVDAIVTSVINKVNPAPTGIISDIDLKTALAGLDPSLNIKMFKTAEAGGGDDDLAAFLKSMEEFSTYAGDDFGGAANKVQYALEKQPGTAKKILQFLRVDATFQQTLKWHEKEMVKLTKLEEDMTAGDAGVGSTRGADMQGPSVYGDPNDVRIAKPIGKVQKRIADPKKKKKGKKGVEVQSRLPKYEEAEEGKGDTVEVTLPIELANVLHEVLMDATSEEAVEDYSDVPEEDAEYQGRKVTLNKPTRGDVKKFKVYVKDPKTGNVKKVNFGHGGTSAKRKTMRIRKSNPKARKSFRARHKCDQKKSKLSAGYWSCRKW